MVLSQQCKLTALVGALIFTFLFTEKVDGQDTINQSTGRFQETIEASNYFTFNLSYTNNSITDKTLNGIQVAAGFADISFYHKSGIYGSILPNFYLNTTQLTYDFDVALGFQKSFDFGFDYSVEYFYHTFNGDSILRGIDYQNGLSLSLGYSFKNIELFADCYGLFGTSNNFISTQGISYNAEFDDLLFNEDCLTFFPTILAVFSTDHWLYDDIGPKYEYWFKRFLNYKGYNTNSFEFQSVDFVLPISYSVLDYTFTFSYFYTMPSDKYKLLYWENQSSIMVSLTYFLNLD